MLRKQNIKLELEHLEWRDVPATLSILGVAGPDSVLIRDYGAGKLEVVQSGKTTSYRNIDRVLADLKAGNDILDIHYLRGSAQRFTDYDVKLGAGNDQISITVPGELPWARGGDGNTQWLLNGGDGDDSFSINMGNPQFPLTLDVSGDVKNLIQGEAGNDSLWINLHGINFNASASFDAQLGAGNDQANLTAQKVRYSSLARTIVDTAAGNDRVAFSLADMDRNNATIPVSVLTGDGNDTVEGVLYTPTTSSNRQQPSELFVDVGLGNGNDRFDTKLEPIPDDSTPEGRWMQKVKLNVQAGAGNDSLKFQADILVSQGELNVHLNGEAGNDAIFSDGISNPLILTTFNPQPEPPIFRYLEDLDGGAGNDTINSSSIIAAPSFMGTGPALVIPLVQMSSLIKGGTGNDTLASLSSINPVILAGFHGGVTPPDPSHLLASSMNIQMNGGAGNDRMSSQNAISPTAFINNSPNQPPIPSHLLDGALQVMMDGGTERDDLFFFAKGNHSNSSPSGIASNDELGEWGVDLRGGDGDDTMNALMGMVNFENHGFILDAGRGNDKVAASLFEFEYSYTATPFSLLSRDGNDTVNLTMHKVKFDDNGLLLEAGAGNDRLNLSIDDMQINAHTDLHVMGGVGNDTVNFGIHNALINNGGQIAVLVDGAAGNDDINFEAAWQIAAGGSSKVDLLGGIGGDHVMGRKMNHIARGGYSSLNIDGGAGHDELGFSYEDATVDGEFRFTMQGGDGNDVTEVDVERVEIKGQFELTTALGAGDDSIVGHFRDIRAIGDTQERLRGHHFISQRFDLGSGNDTVNLQVEGLLNDGLFELESHGGSGDDEVGIVVIGGRVGRDGASTINIDGDSGDDAAKTTFNDLVNDGMVAVNTHGGGGGDEAGIIIINNHVGPEGRTDVKVDGDEGDDTLETIVDGLTNEGFVAVSSRGGEGGDEVGIIIINNNEGPEGFTSFSFHGDEGDDLLNATMLAASFNGDFMMNSGEGDDIVVADFSDVAFNNPFKPVFILSGDGDDSVDLNLSDVQVDQGGFMVNTGQGDDVLTTSVAGSETIFGLQVEFGDGDDVADFSLLLSIPPEADFVPTLNATVNGGAGDDLINIHVTISPDMIGHTGFALNLVADGGNGDDTIEVEGVYSANPSYIFLSQAILKIRGGNGDDHLRGIWPLAQYVFVSGLIDGGAGYDGCVKSPNFIAINCEY